MTMLRARLVPSILVATLAIAIQPVDVGNATERLNNFFVLRSDQITVWVSLGQRESLSCSITGTGDNAQMQCNSYSTENSFPLVYHTALLVGSDGVGYVVKCGGGLLRRIGCHPLNAGSVLPGIVKGGKIAISEGEKTSSYGIVTSAFIGNVSAPASPEGSQGIHPEPRTQNVSSEGPTVKPVTHDESAVAPGPKGGAVQTGGVGQGDRCEAMIMSDPKGGEIYVDGKFVGNTPSVLSLTQGPHKVEVTLKGYKPWARDLESTTGSKITIQAVLEQ
jgi:hypothetical protein